MEDIYYYFTYGIDKHKNRNNDKIVTQVNIGRNIGGSFRTFYLYKLNHSQYLKRPVIEFIRLKASAHTFKVSDVRSRLEK